MREVKTCPGPLRLNEPLLTMPREVLGNAISGGNQAAQPIALKIDPQLYPTSIGLSDGMEPNPTT